VRGQDVGIQPSVERVFAASELKFLNRMSSRIYSKVFPSGNEPKKNARVSD